MDSYLSNQFESNSSPLLRLFPMSDTNDNEVNTKTNDAKMRKTPSPPTSVLYQSKKRKRKVYSWKRPSDKPKRPACAYNLFFYLERERILRGDVNPKIYSAEDATRAANAQIHDKPKRKHVKTHGKIAFTDLSKTIATNWKMLNPNDRIVFDQQASIIAADYAIKLAKWKQTNNVTNNNEQRNTDTSSATTNLSLSKSDSENMSDRPCVNSHSMVNKAFEEQHNPKLSNQSLSNYPPSSLPHDYLSTFDWQNVNQVTNALNSQSSTMRTLRPQETLQLDEINQWSHHNRRGMISTGIDPLDESVDPPLYSTSNNSSYANTTTKDDHTELMYRQKANSPSSIHHQYPWEFARSLSNIHSSECHSLSPIPLRNPHYSNVVGLDDSIMERFWSRQPQENKNNHGSLSKSNSMIHSHYRDDHHHCMTERLSTTMAQMDHAASTLLPPHKSSHHDEALDHMVRELFDHNTPDDDDAYHLPKSTSDLHFKEQ
jgi:hypothetical protein